MVAPHKLPQSHITKVPKVLHTLRHLRCAPADSVPRCIFTSAERDESEPMCMATCLQTSKLCEYRVSNVQVEAILHTLGLVTPPYDRITCYNPILRLHKSQGNTSSGRRAHILPRVRGACSKVKPKIQGVWRRVARRPTVMRCGPS